MNIIIITALNLWKSISIKSPVGTIKYIYLLKKAQWVWGRGNAKVAIA